MIEFTLKVLQKEKIYHIHVTEHRIISVTRLPTRADI